MTSLTPKLGSWALQKPGAFAKDDTLLPTSALVAAKRIAPPVSRAGGGPVDTMIER